MPGLSIHVVDVAHGVPAAGMRVRVRALDAGTEAVEGIADASGVVRLGDWSTRTLPAGRYEAQFEIAAFYRNRGVALPAVPFVDCIAFAFGIDDPRQHYHLPLKITPWGLSLFRGGA